MSSLAAAVDPAPGVAVPVVAAGPTTDMDADTVDGLLPGVADFGPASAWGDEDVVTTTIPGGADFDPTSLGSAWGDADDATTGVITADPGTDIDVGTAGDLFPDVVDFDPHPAWDDGDGVTAAITGGADFDPTSPDLAWGDGDVATAATPCVDIGAVATSGIACSLSPVHLCVA